MKAALVTPFLSHLPLHPGSYLGYGAGILKGHCETDVFDLNAGIYFKNQARLMEILSDMDRAEVVIDQLLLDPFYCQLSGDVEQEAKPIPWSDYQEIFITPPSWFVTVSTKEILRLHRLIKDASPETRVSFFGNSLGTWTDQSKLKIHNIHIRHLNDLLEKNPVNKPVDFDALPTPIYASRDKYLFDMLAFRLKHGCNWGQCRFCSLARGWNAGYLERSPEKVIQELEALIDQYDPKMFVCRDNSLNGGNLLDFCNAFKEFNKPWAGMARADLSVREIQALKRSGCRFVYFGLESGSDRVLREMKKGIDSAQMSRFVKALYDHGIMPAPSVFVGSPGETEKDFKKTTDFILDHADYLDVINAYPLMPSPASDFTRTGQGPHADTFFRLQELIRVCRDSGLKVCVGEQSAEYVLFKKVYPGGRHSLKIEDWK
jgi:hypothetical protein